VKDKPLTFVTEIAPDLPTSYGDRRRLRQIFLNLLANAVKFTPEGTITIKASKEEDGGVHVSICDTGIGIAPENQALIFESFKQVKSHDLPDAVGTGLGLSITKYFVETHGGTISVESEVGKGTIFHVRLPILTEEKAKAINIELATAELKLVATPTAVSAASAS
jgi:signal transduction histidine kinase